MDKVTIPISKEDVLKGLAELPPDELERIIEVLKKFVASHRIRPKYADVKRLDMLIGIMSVGGDAVADTEDIYD